jgi:hypothetical protein
MLHYINPDKISVVQCFLYFYFIKLNWFIWNKVDRDVHLMMNGQSKDNW